jgi:hypothetical protein
MSATVNKHRLRIVITTTRKETGLNIDRIDLGLLNVSTLKNPLSSKTALMVTATSGSSSTTKILSILVSGSAFVVDIFH